MTPVRPSLYYPQSNGKLERWRGTLKRECIRPGVLLSLNDARRVVCDYIHHYNHVRLNSAIGYIAPIDKLKEPADEIFKKRDLKLEMARQARKEKRVGMFQGNNPPRQGPISSGEHLVEAHSRISGLGGATLAVKGR